MAYVEQTVASVVCPRYGSLRSQNSNMQQSELCERNSIQFKEIKNTHQIKRGN